MIKKLILLLIVTLFSISAIAEGFTLSSTDVHGQLSNEQVFNRSGCRGKNISPQLSWKNAPPGTKSFAMTVYDPDAPTGSGWWHWVVFNIPTDINQLKTGASNTAMPVGSTEGMSSYGTSGFGGACPPKGDKPHRYVFTVYALNIKKIDQPANVRPELIGFLLNGHAIAKASIIAYYGRK